MTKQDLTNIFSAPYQLSEWRRVLTEVFNVRQLHLQPQRIPLRNQEKTEGAFELGNFNTSDDRIIGLYQVNVKPEVWLERNKVGLRELLRDVYKHDVDGALIVFVQEDKWRLSFVSEIRMINDEGEIETKATEPKRYTYLLGKGEKTKTPVTRLSAIAGKTILLEDIRSAFSVEALNEEFYKIVAKHFYQLVGATEGKGAKAFTHERVLKLPGISPADKTGSTIYQEFAVRLIGRTVFGWFLKVKKSEEGISLLPEHLLSSLAVRNNPNYYHFILEKIFFQTLNTPMEERIKELPPGAEQIPFLNGGLFEPHEEDYYKPNKRTGLSDNINTLVIPDVWFISFFESLEQYNFTIDENSVVDIEVSVDPEMLGRIFENLLAEIDPDSGETARKATGSFYTPREIVDYMATESLVYYLHNETGIDNESLHSLFKIDDPVNGGQIIAANRIEILQALDRLKVLDPACGSGAFPMGVLQKIVMALQKLDKDANWWINNQVEKNTHPYAREAVREKLTDNPEYARKIGVIQNSLYGVDIQPIAAEISKLRCFLTLIVDENIDETKPNRGVEPLPNLEFKFVTADALLKLPEDAFFGGLYSHTEELSQLQQLRLDYLQSFGEQKERIKQEFKRIQSKIYKEEIKHKNTGETRAYKISTWDPFGHEKVDWFDPLWMYGVQNFDIVIGNPPYVSAIELKKSLSEIVFKTLKKDYETAKGTVDLFIYFFEKGLKLLKKKGQLAYISPNRYLSASYGEGLRKYIFDKAKINEIVDYSHVRVFKAASTYPVVTFLSFEGQSVTEYRISIGKYNEKTTQIDYKQVQSNKLDLLEGYIWGHLLNDKLRITEKVISNSVLITDCGKINATSTASEADEYHPLINEDEGFKLINTGTIDKYVTLWGKEYLTDKGEKYLAPYLPYNHPTISKNRRELYSSPKIILAKIAINTEAFLDIKGEYASINTNCFHSFKSGYSPKYVLAWLNSKLFQYTFECFFEGLKMQGGYLLYSSPNLSKMYIKKPTPQEQKVFDILVDYILYIKGEDKSAFIVEGINNKFLLELFDEIVDALIYELYFKEEFQNAKVKFFQYAERDIVSIEEKGEREKTQAINDVFKRLSEKDNEIRQNLKLMDTRLGDLIMPIKTAS
ncbi:MAG: Eco57I restriction-modification methylase domain-containing protein [Flavisolibacter sp.]